MPKESIDQMAGKPKSDCVRENKRFDSSRSAFLLLFIHEKKEVLSNWHRRGGDGEFGRAVKSKRL